ncbi:MAG: tetratricopeptide repeat protein [Chloroflexi bacterium]|nr:tetratricopeptide repeat protein [Chloroflexota bacterium]
MSNNNQAAGGFSDRSISINNPDDIKKALDAGNINHEKAFKVLNPLLAKNPGDSSLLLLQARLLWSSDNIDAARKILDRILEKEPGNVSTLTFKINILMDQNKNEEAMNCMAALEKLDPANPADKLLKARVLLANRRTDLVKPIMKDLIKQEPGNIKYYKYLLDTYDVNDDQEEGKKIIRAALERKWENPKDKSYLLTRLAEMVWMTGNVPEAVRNFDEALKYDPDNAHARGQLSICMADIMDVKEQRAEVMKAIKLKDYNTPYPYYAIANLMISDGLFDQAKLYIHSAIKRFPGDVTGYLLLGKLSFDIYDYREARKAYFQASVLRPGKYDPLMGLAMVDLVRRDTDSAEKILSSIKPPKHRRAEHCRFLGELYFERLRDYPKAREYLQKATEYMDNEEDPSIATVSLGKIELKYNNDREAEKYFQKALSKLPRVVEQYEILAAYLEIIDGCIRSRKYKLADKYIAAWEKEAAKRGWGEQDMYSSYLRFATDYIFNGDIERAHQLIKKGSGGDAQIFPYGEIMVIFHENEKLAPPSYKKGMAESFYKKMVDKNPDEPSANFYMGLFAEEKGDAGKAAGYYKKASRYYTSPGGLDYRKAWVYAISRKKESALKALKKACNKNIYNVCRVYHDEAFDWMRDDPFFTTEVPQLLKQVKDKTPPPDKKDLKWY